MIMCKRQITAQRYMNTYIMNIGGCDEVGDFFVDPSSREGTMMQILSIRKLIGKECSP